MSGFEYGLKEAPIGAFSYARGNRQWTNTPVFPSVFFNPELAFNRSSATSGNLQLDYARNDAGSPAAMVIRRMPGIPLFTNYRVAGFYFGGATNSSSGNILNFSFECIATADWNPTAAPNRVALTKTNLTGTARQTIIQLLPNNDVEFFTPVFFRAPFQPPQYLLSTLPSAAAFPGSLIEVTNATSGSKTCKSDGTNWLILNTTTPVS